MRGRAYWGSLRLGRKRKLFVIGQEEELAAMAQEATHWLELAWKVAGTQEEGERAAALAGVGAAIGAEETSSAILGKVTAEAARLCGAHLASLFLFDGKSDTLRLEVCEGDPSGIRCSLHSMGMRQDWVLSFEGKSHGR